MAQKNHRPHKKIWLFAATIASIALVLTLLEVTNTTHLFHSSTPASKVIKSAGVTTKDQSSAVTSTTTPGKQLSTSNSVQGGATDNAGQASTSTDSSQWVISKSGIITVKSPAASVQIQDGAVVSGSAKVSGVQYRLIDDQAGVLAQGPLNVVSGNFSGTLHFRPQSTSGRLDVFSYDANDAEINEVQIGVKF